jgi:hypothetical protein
MTLTDEDAPEHTCQWSACDFCNDGARVGTCCRHCDAYGTEETQP